MSESRGPAAGGAAVAADPRRWRALAMLALVQFMIAIDNTVVNVALPSISRELDISTVGLAWVVNGYLLAAGALLLLGGRVADLVGRRRMFMIGTAVFAVASLGAGLAQNGGMLITFRFLQGAGEAIAAPAALSMVPLLFGNQKERAKAFGIWGGIAGLGATIGVLLSGVIVGFTDWRLIFLINVPIAAVPLLMITRLADESRGEQAAGRPIDIPAAVLVCLGCLGVVYGLLNAAGHGWAGAGTLAPLIVGVLALVVLIFWEARSENPLLPLRFFANRTRVSANLGTIVVAGSMMTLFFLVVLYMQDVLGLSPLQTGLAYLPFMAAFTVGLVASTNLLPRIGARTIIVVALIIAAAGMYTMTRVTVDGSYVADLLLPLCLTALGLGMANPALQSAAMHQVTTEDSGMASGVQTAVMQAGSAIGLAVFAAIAIRQSTSLTRQGENADAALVTGLHTGMLVVAAVMVVGAVLVLLCMGGGIREVPASTPGAGAEQDDGDEPGGTQPATAEPSARARDGEHTT